MEYGSHAVGSPGFARVLFERMAPVVAGMLADALRRADAGQLDCAGVLGAHQAVVAELARVYDARGVPVRPGAMRGLLVFHSMGTGKTLSTAAIMLAFQRFWALADQAPARRINAAAQPDLARFLPHVYLVSTPDNLTNNTPETYVRLIKRFFPGQLARMTPKRGADLNAWLLRRIGGNPAQPGVAYSKADVPGAVVKRISFEMLANQLFTSQRSSEGLLQREAFFREPKVLIIDEVHNLAEYARKDPSSPRGQLYRWFVRDIADSPMCLAFVLSGTPGKTRAEFVETLNIVRPCRAPPFTASTPAARFRGLVSFVDLQSDRTKVARVRHQKVLAHMNDRYTAAYVFAYGKDVEDKRATQHKYDPARPQCFLSTVRQLGDYLTPRQYEGWLVGDPGDRGVTVPGPGGAARLDLVSTKLVSVAKRVRGLAGKHYVYTAFAQVHLGRLLDRAGLRRMDPAAHFPDANANEEAVIQRFFRSVKTPFWIEYAVAAGATPRPWKTMMDAFNHPANAGGKYIKCLVASGRHYEGLDLKAVACVHLVEPLPNQLMLRQAIGRGPRVCGHDQLPAANRLVRVFHYLAVPNPKVTPAYVRKLYPGAQKRWRAWDSRYSAMRLHRRGKVPGGDAAAAQVAKAHQEELDAEEFLDDVRAEAVDAPLFHHVLHKALYPRAVQRFNAKGLPALRTATDLANAFKRLPRARLANRSNRSNNGANNGANGNPRRGNNRNARPSNRPNRSNRSNRSSSNNGANNGANGNARRRPSNRSNRSNRSNNGAAAWTPPAGNGFALPSTEFRAQAVPGGSLSAAALVARLHDAYGVTPGKALLSRLVDWIGKRNDRRWVQGALEVRLEVYARGPAGSPAAFVRVFTSADNRSRRVARVLQTGPATFEALLGTGPVPENGPGAAKELKRLGMAPKDSNLAQGTWEWRLRALVDKADDMENGLEEVLRGRRLGAGVLQVIKDHMVALSAVTDRLNTVARVQAAGPASIAALSSKVHALGDSMAEVVRGMRTAGTKLDSHGRETVAQLQAGVKRTEQLVKGLETLGARVNAQTAQAANRNAVLHARLNSTADVATEAARRELAVTAALADLAKRLDGLATGARPNAGVANALAGLSSKLDGLRSAGESQQAALKQQVRKLGRKVDAEGVLTTLQRVEAAWTTDRRALANAVNGVRALLSNATGPDLAPALAPVLTKLAEVQKQQADSFKKTTNLLTPLEARNAGLAAEIRRVHARMTSSEGPGPGLESLVEQVLALFAGNGNGARAVRDSVAGAVRRALAGNGNGARAVRDSVAGAVREALRANGPSLSAIRTSLRNAVKQDVKAIANTLGPELKRLSDKMGTVAAQVGNVATKADISAADISRAAEALEQLRRVTLGLTTGTPADEGMAGTLGKYFATLNVLIAERLGEADAQAVAAAQAQAAAAQARETATRAERDAAKANANRAFAAASAAAEQAHQHQQRLEQLKRLVESASRLEKFHANRANLSRRANEVTGRTSNANVASLRNEISTALENWRAGNLRRNLAGSTGMLASLNASNRDLKTRRNALTATMAARARRHALLGLLRGMTAQQLALFWARSLPPGSSPPSNVGAFLADERVVTQQALNVAREIHASNAARQAANNAAANNAARQAANNAARQAAARQAANNAARRATNNAAAASGSAPRSEFAAMWAGMTHDHKVAVLRELKPNFTQENFNELSRRAGEPGPPQAAVAAARKVLAKARRGLVEDVKKMTPAERLAFVKALNPGNQSPNLTAGRLDMALRSAEFVPPEAYDVARSICVVRRMNDAGLANVLGVPVGDVASDRQGARTAALSRTLSELVSKMKRPGGKLKGPDKKRVPNSNGANNGTNTRTNARTNAGALANVTMLSNSNFAGLARSLTLNSELRGLPANRTKPAIARMLSAMSEANRRAALNSATNRTGEFGEFYSSRSIHQLKDFYGFFNRGTPRSTDKAAVFECIAKAAGSRAALRTLIKVVPVAMEFRATTQAVAQRAYSQLSAGPPDVKIPMLLTRIAYILARTLPSTPPSNDAQFARKLSERMAAHMAAAAGAG